MFDTTGGDSSSSSEWDGSFPFDSYWQDYRIADFGSDNHAINGAVMWGVFIFTPTGANGGGTGDGLYHLYVQMKENGNQLTLWHGTSSSLTGSYSFMEGSNQGLDTVTIVAGSSSPLTITTGSPLPDGGVGVGYSQQIGCSGGGGGSYSWSVASGSLPDGLSLDTSSGAISGTPTTTGTYYFNIQAQDGTGATSADFQITVGSLTLTTSSLPDGAGGISYSQSLGVSYGSGSYSWTVSSGSLPPGLSLDTSSGVISGTPTATGTCSFMVTVTDQTTSISAQANLQITIGNPPPLTVSTSSLPDAMRHVPYSSGDGFMG